MSKQEDEGKKYGMMWKNYPEDLEMRCQEELPVFKEVKGKELLGSDTGLDQKAIFEFIDEPAISPTHLLLEGDNYHILSTLNYTHRDKIDVICIDPPYNTGNSDFMYNDKMVGTDDSYRHSKWLSFMYKRLSLAKTLLKNTGSIFIMIGDDEFAQLKLLCDQVFGERNFRNCIIWSYGGGGVPGKGLSRKHDYILFYTKSDNFKWNRITQEFADTSSTMHFNHVDEDGRRYRIRKIGDKEYRYYLDEGKACADVWDDVSPQISSSPIQKEYTGFTTQKPTALFMRMIEATTNKNSTILDFFAGSGTTGHAVLQLNKKDGGNRQFVLCTNNENNICRDTCYPRIVKAMKELGGSLKYFKTGFVKRSRDIEQMKHDIMTKCTEMLCVKEGIYNILDKQENYQVFEQDNKKFMAIYYNFTFLDNDINDLKEKMNDTIGEKVLYYFTLDERLLTDEEFEGWKNIRIEPIPEEMLNIYKSIFGR